MWQLHGEVDESKEDRTKFARGADLVKDFLCIAGLEHVGDYAFRVQLELCGTCGERPPYPLMYEAGEEMYQGSGFARNMLYPRAQRRIRQ